MRFRRNEPSVALLFTLCIAVLAGAGSQIALARRALAESDIKDDFRRLALALQDADEKRAKEALETIVRSGGPERMERLLSFAMKLPSGHDSLYWTVLSAVAGFADQPSLTELGKTLVAHKSSPLAADILYALARNRTRNVPSALCPVLEEGTVSLQIQAAEQLGHLRVPAAVDCLIEALKAEEQKAGEPSVLAGSIIESLTEITGKRFGFNSVNWEGWWKKHRGEPLLGAEEDSGRTVTGTAVDTLDARRRKAYLALEEAPEKGIVVLSAVFKREDKVKDFNNDHMEKVLDRMGIPHTVVERENFLAFDLRETGAILINCALSKPICVCPTCIPSGEKVDRLYKCSGCNVHEKVDPTLSGAQIRKLQKFVRSGGYLFCEDWVVKELVEPGFPRYVAAGQKLSKGVVDVVPIRGMTRHPYLEGIFVPLPEANAEAYDLATDLDLDFDLDLDEEGEKGESEKETEEGKGKTVVVGVPEVPVKEEEGEVPDPEPRIVDIDFHWQIDDESFALHVVDSSRVVGLLGSGELRKQTGNDFLVAVAFRPGSSLPVGQRSSRGAPGVIVQVLSHFGKQGTRADEHTLENLLLNFLIDANTTRRKRTGGP